MLFWIYMFLVTLIIPCAMYFVGKKYLTSPPKYINNTKGFRTKRSNEKSFDMGICSETFWKVVVQRCPLDRHILIFGYAILNRENHSIYRLLRWVRYCNSTRCYYHFGNNNEQCT